MHIGLASLDDNANWLQLLILLRVPLVYNFLRRIVLSQMLQFRLILDVFNERDCDELSYLTMTFTKLDIECLDN